MTAYTIYKIVCSANGKAYVGYTSKSAEARFQTHLLNARWKRKTALYDAIRCYGPDAFAVSVLLECATHAEACDHERRFIAELNTLLPLGYNMTQGGDGVPLTEEQRARANAKKRGRCSPKQLVANQRRKGTKASPETIAKLVAMRKGKKQSPEHVRRRVEAFRRNRAAKLGIPYAEKPVETHKPRTYNRGAGKRIWSEETRQAERERAVKQWTPEAREAARQRAVKQWTPEAREAARTRALLRFANKAAERKIA